MVPATMAGGERRAMPVDGAPLGIGACGVQSESFGPTLWAVRCAHAPRRDDWPGRRLSPHRVKDSYGSTPGVAA